MVGIVYCSLYIPTHSLTQKKDNMNTSLISAVKELLERHWDCYEIAVRLGVDMSIVQQILDNIT